jgi:RNA polymerase sigma factor (sigma-70 family)
MQHEAAGRTDGQLLEEYLGRREQAALEVLVRRHAPMVWGVCQRVLRNYHDAEDAFQATFLVLVRKAASIAAPELLPNWLYGVAHQTALKARASAAKRRTRERQVPQMPERAATEPQLWNDLQPLLDQELSRLPDIYRVAIVLCDLEGKTRADAARQLGVPAGTLAARLARGRGMLAKRLARHGLTVSGGALGAMLAQTAEAACVPSSVLSITIKAAPLFAVGQAVATALVSARVAALTQGVLKTMVPTKLKTVLAVLLVLGMIGLGNTLVTTAADRATKAAENAAQDEKAPTASDGAIAANAGKEVEQPAVAKDQPRRDPGWQPMVAELAKDGGLCGIVVDHNTGCVWINVIDKGVYCSPAGAKDFQRVKGYHLSGTNETPGGWLLDPTGKSKRAVTALVHGCQCSVSPDHLATWVCMSEQAKHVNWCAVDWTDPDLKFVLALKHDAGGLLLGSRDGGKTFREVGKGYATGWVFDGQTAVVAQAKTKDRPRPTLMRTTDGGKTFKPCGLHTPVGTGSGQALPKWHDGVLYWLVEGGLIATTDKGKTWKLLSDLDGQYGPVFGKDAKHLFVLTKAGILESTDGGVSWTRPISPPRALNGISPLTWIEYDPPRDLLYLMKRGSDLYKLARGSGPASAKRDQLDTKPTKDQQPEPKSGQRFEGEIDLKTNEGNPGGEGFTVGYRVIVPITLKAGTNFSASVTVVGRNRRVGLLLKDPTGKTLGSSKMEPRTARISIEEVNANGKYTIQVYSDLIGPYTLWVTDTVDQLDRKALEEKISRLENELAVLREKLRAKGKEKPN